MPDSIDSSSTFELLRQQAESLILRSPDASPNIPTDIIELIHELKIHHAELEIQNEELKRAQNELSELNREFRNLYEFAPCGYITLNPKGIITRANLTAVNLLQTTREFLCGSGFNQYIADGWSSIYQEAREKAKESGKQNVELPLKTKNETPVWIRTEIAAEPDSTGAVVQWRLMLIDITEQKKASKAIARRDARYRKIMESMPDAIYVCSNDQTIEYMNPSMIKRLSRNAEGEICYRAIHGMDQPCPWCSFETVKNGITIDENIVSPLDNRTYHVTHIPVVNDDQTISKLTIYRDITDYQNAVAEREKARTELIQVQKMESIGIMAGGIAHDFNNILYPLIGNAEMLQKDLPHEMPEQENVSEILKAAFRASDLVKQILTFSRKDNSQDLKPVSLNLILIEALKLLKSTISPTIDIQTDFDPDCGMVMAESTHLFQVIMNLAMNSYHAMQKSGGQLTVVLKQTAIETKHPDFPGLPPDNYAVIKVIDTGEGIKKELIDKLFEPYFTTKAVGSGTGLGLSVVLGIVKSYHGDINIYSEPGKGTEVHVYLPITQKIASKSEPDSPLSVIGGTERLLLVDDEASIIKIEKRMLNRLGYQVTSKTESHEALETFKANPDGFDLIISDMTMPNMSGVQLAQSLIEIRPDIPVIICTGYSGERNKESMEASGIKGLLMKPVSMSDMAHKVREVLDEAKGCI